MASISLAFANDRRDEREEVHHRTYATVDGEHALMLLVVNISRSGLMARCEHRLESGTELSFRLPGIDALTAGVRWTLGGRIGCEFTTPIPANIFYALLPRLRS